MLDFSSSHLPQTQLFLLAFKVLLASDHFAVSGGSSADLG
jgi:hypothetical protein